jgi:hypothetical protein
MKIPIDGAVYAGLGAYFVASPTASYHTAW